jgi:hypothetical protein
VEGKGGAGPVLAAAVGGSDEGRGGRRGLGVALGRGARGAGRRRRGVPQLGHGAGAAARRRCGDSGGSELFGSSRVSEGKQGWACWNRFVQDGFISLQGRDWLPARALAGPW